nr:hypothetical protein CFP56_30290 [Quercus suber]
MLGDMESEEFGVTWRPYTGSFSAGSTGRGLSEGISGCSRPSFARGPSVQDSEEAEALACRRAVESAMDAGFTEII